MYRLHLRPTLSDLLDLPLLAVQYLNLVDAYAYANTTSEWWVLKGTTTLVCVVLQTVRVRDYGISEADAEDSVVNVCFADSQLPSQELLTTKGERRGDLLNSRRMID